MSLDPDDVEKQEIGGDNNPVVPPVNPVSVGKVEEVTDEELKNNPYLLEETVSVGPNSFVDKRQDYRKMCPPPKYFTTEIL